MPRFYIDDFAALERVPSSPQLLQAKLGHVILSSTQSRVSVESIDPETGQYRVVLTGRLDMHSSRERRW
ncbi:MAG TPA: hypothetical protein VJV23_07985 [Candidatus Polarisedimenticolia bacterium]|nr:hypothetical protein [Candidatus Polarisedimenticolia bacterium]